MIAVVLYTFSPSSQPDLAAVRQQYAEATLASLFKHLRTERGLWLHVADDGSAPEYREHLWELAGQYVGANRSISNSERRGYGGSYNSASHIVHQLGGLDAILQMEDDWVLSRDLDLDPLVNVLQTEPHIGCIRLGLIGYYHPLRAEFLWTQDQHFLLLDPNSQSQYIWSGGPRLETVAWARGVGPWPERLRAGETELAVCGRTAARHGVAWPVDLIPPRGGLFNHIGTHAVKDVTVERQAVSV